MSRTGRFTLSVYLRASFRLNTKVSSSENRDLAIFSSHHDDYLGNLDVIKGNSIRVLRHYKDTFPASFLAKILEVFREFQLPYYNSVHISKCPEKIQ